MAYREGRAEGYLPQEIVIRYTLLVPRNTIILQYLLKLLTP